MASVERLLFIYFNIYYLGFMQIVACVSCDVSLISSYHLPSLLFNLVPIDLLYFPTITIYVRSCRSFVEYL